MRLLPNTSTYFEILEFESAVDIVHEFEHLYTELQIDKVEVIYNNFQVCHPANGSRRTVVAAFSRSSNG